MRRIILGVTAAAAILVPTGGAALATGVVSAPAIGSAVQHTDTSVEALTTSPSGPRKTCGSRSNFGIC